MKKGLLVGLYCILLIGVCVFCYLSFSFSSFIFLVVRTILAIVLVIFTGYWLSPILTEKVEDGKQGLYDVEQPLDNPVFVLICFAVVVLILDIAVVYVWWVWHAK